MKKLFVSLYCLGLSLNAVAKSEPINFLVFGDMPYSSKEAEWLQKDGKLAKAAEAAQHDFYVHVGDMKASIQSCTDMLLKENYALISHVSDKPFVYTPGDNDWTDCDRSSLLDPKDELERLAFIRAEFTKSTPALPKFKRQESMKENQSWNIDGVQFLTIHAVATNNGRRQIKMSDEAKAYQEVDARDQHNFDWLEQNLPKKGHKAAVVFTQADLFVEAKHKGQCTTDNPKKCDGLEVYRDKLDGLAKQLDYPLLLVHGDTPDFCFSERKSGLWHLNAPGDVKVIDIAQVEINPDAEKPFSVKALLGSSFKACPKVSKD
ncbi:hypothetical protein [Pseudoalteromonas xiamenensis]